MTLQKGFPSGAQPRLSPGADAATATAVAVEDAVSRKGLRTEAVPKGTVLVVEDEDAPRDVCCDVVGEMGLTVHRARTTEEALELLEQTAVDMVLSDLKVPKLGGIKLLERIRHAYPEVDVLILTQYGSIETAVQATRLGAFDYVTKPFHLDDLRRKVDQRMRARSLDQENHILREELRSRPGFGELVGVSQKMHRVYKLIEKVSHHNYPVLILGESGTGKELVARSIHFSGPRKDKPFVPVDCSALVPTLIESELFGHVKGAFTGAQAAKQGLLESAANGTLFLDEIGDMPADLQAKLLRALQEREIKPVGSTNRVPIHVRVMAATNRDLETAIRTGAFRQDLYFRLNVVQIKLPPLRERRNDIPHLIHWFLDKYSDPERQTPTFSQEAVQRLLAYDWPGNIRELENVVERAVALSSGPILQITDLPTNLQHGGDSHSLDTDELVPLDELERRAIFRALRETSGDKLAAARLLGIGKTTLYRKLKHYGNLSA